MRWNVLLALIALSAISCSSTSRSANPPSAVASPTSPTTVPARIDSFQGQYRFLSNFWPAEVEYEHLTYPSVEHAYQSAKTLSMDDRRRIASMPTPAEAKAEGHKLNPLRPDWEQVKFQVMEDCVRYKFTHHPDLCALLLTTGDAHLEEGNTWNDTIWGTVNGVGDNRLGKLLMKIRDELRRPSTRPG
jgi:ribA/ribD-fused uncharacterized protein